MFDLGKYALPVLLSYGASLVFILGLLAMSIMRQRKIRREISKITKRTS